MKVVFVGLRGFPDVQGGVETHCENLCPLLVDLGLDVVVIVRSPYVNKGALVPWKGVTFKRVWSPKSKSLEALIHTFISVLLCGIVIRPDIIHIQAIGPSIWVPLARTLGLKVVVTHHGPDYDRQKWGGFAKVILKLGERFGMCYANKAIVISKTIQQLVKKKHGVDTVRIPNGVNIPELVKSTVILDEFGARPNRYVLMVTRLVPEKRHLDLIEAFIKSNMKDWKLLIVGESDHPDDYSRQVVDLAEQYDDVIMAGFQSGCALNELYTHAGLFVLPSSHEGLPIALLEALSYGLPVIASDIPSNAELGLASNHYYPLGDIHQLSVKLTEWANTPFNESMKNDLRTWVFERYNWQEIADSTNDVYRPILNRL